MVVPPPAGCSAAIDPPWASTSWRAIASPRPDPLDSSPFAKRSKMCGRTSGSTPGPLSETDTVTSPGTARPTTETVLRTPLLIVPPWINKFYILDLKPEKSFIKWCVDQGITVFVISWVNPDKNLGAKTWEDYMKEGPLAAMDAIERATGEMKVHTMGYCVGGTLLATTLAWLAEKRRVRVTSATFLAAQVDFTHAGV